jgi:hypothetical protein
MSADGLNTLVGRACISELFQAELMMTGKRAELVQKFDIEPEEARALLGIQAETFADFAAEVEQLLAQRASRASRTKDPFVVSLCWPTPASTGVYFRHQR